MTRTAPRRIIAPRAAFVAASGVTSLPTGPAARNRARRPPRRPGLAPHSRRAPAAPAIGSVLGRLAGIAAALGLVAGLPTAVAAHGLSPVYESPLPLAAYLVGGALVVALSFAFVIARDVRAATPVAGRPVRVPGPVRTGLRALGLIAWVWIMAQGLAGGSSDAAVAGLILWVFGWVGVAMVSALLFPVWEWLDPFATLFDLIAWSGRRAGIRGWVPTGLSPRARGWPAVVGFAFFAWVELVLEPGTSTLTAILAGYTVLTLVLMAQVGRDAWRAGGEVFTVWFRALNRLAPYGVSLAGDTPDPHHVLRRPFANGLLTAAWTIPTIVLTALGVGSIIFDGLSQTVWFAGVFGAPALPAKTLELAVFLGLVVGVSLMVARDVSPGAIGAGLLPIAVGYLVAHYLTYLVLDGQRIVIAVSDPLQTGADLLGTAHYEVQTGWLPAGLVWTLQLAAVVGGHMVGAWAGHVTAQREMAERAAAKEARDLRHRKIHDAHRPPVRNVRTREIPLALVMVALSTLTLWSLGQAIVLEVEASRATPAFVVQLP